MPLFYEPNGPIYGPGVGIASAILTIHAVLNSFGSGICKILFNEDCFTKPVPRESTLPEPTLTSSTSHQQPKSTIETTAPHVSHRSSFWQEVHPFLFFLMTYFCLALVQMALTKLLDLAKSWKPNALRLRAAKLEKAISVQLERLADLEDRNREKDLLIEQLAREKSTLRSNRERAESGLRAIEQRLARLESDRNAENASRVAMERQVKSLEDEVNMEKSQKEALRDQVATLRQRKAESDEILRVAQKPLRDLEKQKISAEKRAKTYELQAVRFVQLKATLEEEICTLRDEMNDSGLNESDLRAQVAGLRTQIREARNQSKSQRTYFNGLLAKKDDRLRELQKPSGSPYTKIVKRLEEQIKDLNSQISSAKDSQKAAKNEMVALRADKDGATRAVKSLEIQIKAREKLEADAKSAIHGEKAARESAEGLRSQLAAVQEKLRSSQDALAKRDSDGREQQQTLEELRKEHSKEKQAWEQQVVDLRSQIGKARQGHLSLQKSYESLQNTKAVADEGNQQLVQQLESDRQASQKAHDEQAQEISRLQNVIDQMGADGVSLQQEVNRLNSQITELTNFPPVVQLNEPQFDDDQFAQFSDNNLWANDDLGLGGLTPEGMQAANQVDMREIDRVLGIDPDQPAAVLSLVGNDPATSTWTSTELLPPTQDPNQDWLSLDNDLPQVDFNNPPVPNETDAEQAADPNRTVGGLPPSNFMIPGLGPMPTDMQSSTPQVPEADPERGIFNTTPWDSGRHEEPQLQTVVSTAQNDIPFVNPYHGRPMRRPVIRGRQENRRQDQPQEASASQSQASASQSQAPASQSQASASQSQSQNYGSAFPEERLSAEAEAAFNDPSLEVTVAKPKEYFTLGDPSDSDVGANESEEDTASTSGSYEKQPDFEENEDDFLNPFNTADPEPWPETIVLHSPEIKGDDFEGSGPDPETANLDPLDRELLGEQDDHGDIMSHSSTDSDQEQELTETEIDTWTDAEVQRGIDERKAALKALLEKRAEKGK